MSDGKQVEDINTRDLYEAAANVRELRNKIKLFGRQSLTKEEREACYKYGLMLKWRNFGNPSGGGLFSTNKENNFGHLKEDDTVVLLTDPQTKHRPVDTKQENKGSGWAAVLLRPGKRKRSVREFLSAWLEGMTPD